MSDNDYKESKLLIGLVLIISLCFFVSCNYKMYNDRQIKQYELSVKDECKK
jgi:hypothetical protein